MRVLLFSGLGPAFYNEELLAGSLFDRESAAGLARDYFGGFDLDRLHFSHDDGRRLLLRPLPGRGGDEERSSDALLEREAPHLTTWTLESILAAAEIPYTQVDLSRVWQGRDLELPGDADLVLLSTTFIWNRASLASCVARIEDLLPTLRLVLGGQYSNLKYEEIMRAHPGVTCIVRGDAEQAMPKVIHQLRTGGKLDRVPNLVFRAADGSLVENAIEYVDMDSHPSPVLEGRHPIVPYESMRGCPFNCKFCSFPFASPQWRYKSAAKIGTDWAAYAEENGTRHIRAYDSTFPTPPKRFRELLQLLPEVEVSWEAFSRANSIKSLETVEQLVGSHCKMLTLGFESMSPKTLELMKKQVRVHENRTAFELLQQGELGYRASFMVGFPGEAPADFELTHDFLETEYRGHFLLNVFSFMDETMPVWADAEKLGLVIEDEENPDRAWRHMGMDAETARSLMEGALEDVRWHNDGAVHLLWQQRYERPLLPSRSRSENLRVEKLVERLSMSPRRWSDPARAEASLAALAKGLGEAGIEIEGPLPPWAQAAFGSS